MTWTISLLIGLVLNNISSYVQQVIIVFAVTFDTFTKAQRRY